MALLAISQKVIHWIDFVNQWITFPKMPFTPRDKASLLAAALETIEKARQERASAPRPIDVFALRKRLGMTQQVFANRFGFSVATLRHWERGERSPTGASLTLLNVIARNPLVVIRAIRVRDV